MALDAPPVLKTFATGFTEIGPIMAAASIDQKVDYRGSAYSLEELAKMKEVLTKKVDQMMESGLFKEMSPLKVFEDLKSFISESPNRTTIVHSTAGPSHRENSVPPERADREKVRVTVNSRYLTKQTTLKADQMSEDPGTAENA